MRILIFQDLAPKYPSTVQCVSILRALIVTLSLAALPSTAADNSLNVVTARLVYSHPQKSAGKALYVLQVPKHYFRDRSNLLQAQSTSGVSGIALWFLYGTNEGIAGKAIDHYLNKWTPNEGVKIYIRAQGGDSSIDMGKSYLERGLNAPEYSPGKLVLNPAVKLGQGISAYKYVNDKKGRDQIGVSFAQSDGTLVFVNCRVDHDCIAHKTWKGVLDVSYSFFFASFEKNFVGLDEAVNHLIASFKAN